MKTPAAETVACATCGGRFPHPAPGTGGTWRHGTPECLIGHATGPLGATDVCCDPLCRYHGQRHGFEHIARPPAPVDADQSRIAALESSRATWKRIARRLAVRAWNWRANFRSVGADNARNIGRIAALEAELAAMTKQWNGWVGRSATYRVERDEARAKLETAVGLLRALEWEGPYKLYGPGCPSCRADFGANEPGKQHRKDCALAAFLASVERKAGTP